MHRSGSSLIQHVLSVLDVLMVFRPDEDGIIACILHHYLDTDGADLGDLEEDFGPRVRSIVSGVHLLTHVSTQTSKRSIEDLRLMMLTVSSEIQTILITLCDRCQLLEMARSLSPTTKRSIAYDVLNLYAPVAARLGMYGLKHRLEGQAFPILYQNDAERIFEQLSRHHREHGAFLDGAAIALQKELEESGIKADVQTRQKQPYSTFRNLQEKSISHIEDIYDLFAIRVIVENPETCYQALGILHRLAQPIGHRFKDYISFPKPNGYQSLHSTVINMPGAPPQTFVEVQIRTKAMHSEAEFGIASHWMYKQKSSTEQALQNIELSQVLKRQQTIESDGLDQSFTDQIFVLTPKGDVIELPEGSTPLDFAFTVHTQLGLSVRSARVNQSMVPLHYELQNGDVVEILKQKNPNPSPQWLNILKMSSARSKLKRYLYAQDRDYYIVEGKRILNEELSKRTVPLLTSDLAVLRSINGQTLSMHEREEILMKIGQQSEKPAPLLQKLDVLKQEIQPPTKKRTNNPPIQEEKHIILEGNIPLPTRFAKCCNPTKGNQSSVIGLINRQGKVMIHRADCRMIQNANRDRLIGAYWPQSNEE